MQNISNHIKPEDKGDRTPALDRAVAAAMHNAEIVLIPAGTWNFLTKPKPIGGGVTIHGESGIQSAHTGTCLFVRYSEAEPEAGFLTWDGTDPRGHKGTGGGLRDLSIYKYGKQHAGGCAILVKPANCTNFRSGMWTLENVAVISENKGLWDRIALFDGSNIPPQYKEGMGLRVVTLRNFFASGAAVCTVELRNCVHFAWDTGQVQIGPAPTKTPACLKVTGADTQDVHLRSVSVYGLLHLEQGKLVNFDGLATSLRIDAGVKRSYVKALDCDTVSNKSAFEDRVTVITI